MKLLVIKKNYFRFATQGPFQKAWQLIKNNPESFWSSLDDAASMIANDPNVAVFDFKRIMSGREEFKRCLINQIPKT